MSWALFSRKSVAVLRQEARISNLEVASISQRFFTYEYMELLYMESDHSFIKVSTTYFDWQWFSRVSSPSFDITYCLVAGDARSLVHLEPLHAKQMLYY